MTLSKISHISSARIPTDYGQFNLCYYTNTIDDKAHLAFYLGDIDQGEDILVRVHSECFTGDVLGSRRCDCGDQLEQSLRMIAAEGKGVVVYLRQEGRGIGLLQKINAYNLQDAGHDTVDANLLLGHQADERDYTLAACILDDLGVQSIRLMTNNPAKISALKSLGIEVTDRVELECSITPENEYYLKTKASRLNHLLKFDSHAPIESDTDLHEPQPTD